MTVKAIKIILAVLFFICLFDMPYGYYQLVRVTAVVGFSLLAYWAYEQKIMVEVIIYLGLILLFQPLIKVALGREIWNMVDVIVGLGLLISLKK
jgi:hypothetical protein